MNSQSFRDAIANSLILGASAATARHRDRCHRRLVRRAARAGQPPARLLAALPLVFPAIVLGLAFLEMFVHAGARIYGSLLSLVIVSVVAYMPYGLRYAQLGVIQIHPELEEAAAIAGARQGGAFVRIVLPLLVPALISCWLFVFLLAVRAVSLMLLLAGPDSQVVAVALFDFWNNGQIGELAALGCVWTAIMTVFSRRFPDRCSPLSTAHRLTIRRSASAARGKSDEGLRAGGERRRHPQHLLRCHGRRVLHAARSVGLRQDHHLAVCRRSRGAVSPDG